MIKNDKFWTRGIIVLAVVLVALMACEVIFPLKGTALLHMITG